MKKSLEDYEIPIGDGYILDARKKIYEDPFNSASVFLGKIWKNKEAVAIKLRRNR